MSLNCWWLKRLLRSREPEDLTAVQRGRLEAHLASCRACADAFTPLEAPLAELLRDEAEESALRREESVPGELFRPRLEERLRRAGSGRWGWHLMRLPTPLGLRMPQALAGTLVLVVVLAAAFWAQRAFLEREESVRVAEIPMPVKKEAAEEPREPSPAPLAREEPREPAVKLQSLPAAPLALEEAPALARPPAPMREAKPERPVESATGEEETAARGARTYGGYEASRTGPQPASPRATAMAAAAAPSAQAAFTFAHLQLKFRQGTAVRLQDGKLVSLSNSPEEKEKLEEVASLLEEFGVDRIERCARDENLCYRVYFSRFPDSDKLLHAFNECDIVDAELVKRPVLTYSPPADPTP